MSWPIRNTLGRKEDKLLLHKNLGIAILSPHGREGWGLVDFAWSLFYEYDKAEKNKLPVDPERLDKVKCTCALHKDMLAATTLDRGYIGIRTTPDVDLERIQSILLDNPTEYSFISEEAYSNPAVTITTSVGLV